MARDKGTNNDNDAQGVRDDSEMKLKQKTKQNATKHKVNMTCQDEETRYRPIMTRVVKVCARGGYVQCMTNVWKMHMWGKMC